MTKKNLVWKLKSPPCADEIIRAAATGIFTMPEARELLVREVDADDTVKFDNSCGTLTNAKTDNATHTSK